MKEDDCRQAWTFIDKRGWEGCGMSIVDEGSRCSLQERVETDGVEWRQERGVETESGEQLNDVTPPASPFSDKFSGIMEREGGRGGRERGKGAGRGREEREEHGKMGDGSRWCRKLGTFVDLMWGFERERVGLDVD